MDAKGKIEEILNYLNINAKAFSDMLGYERPQIIYDILNGKTKGISDKLANKITSTFPKISRTWLLADYGDMVVEEEKSNSDICSDDTVYNRLEMAVKSNGDNMNTFYRKSGIPQSTLASAKKRNGTINTDILSAVIRLYPRISIEWVITGEGNMINREIEEYKNEIIRLKKLLHSRKSTKLVVELDINDDEFVKMGLKDKIVQVLKLK